MSGRKEGTSIEERIEVSASRFCLSHVSMFTFGSSPLLRVVQDPISKVDNLPKVAKSDHSE